MADDTLTPVIITRKDAKALGLKVYFTGQPCARAGHISTRRTDNGNCSECDRAVQRVLARQRYDADPEKARADAQAYRERNLEAVNARLREWARERRLLDDQWRLRTNAATRLNHVMRRIVKPGSTMDELGCSVPTLVNWLQSQFEPGMDWDNYGAVWWVDHIKPLSAFDMLDRAQYVVATHYTNLRPMFKHDNIKKGGVRRPKLRRPTD